MSPGRSDIPTEAHHRQAKQTGQPRLNRDVGFF